MAFEIFQKLYCSGWFQRSALEMPEFGGVKCGGMEENEAIDDEADVLLEACAGAEQRTDARAKDEADCCLDAERQAEIGEDCAPGGEVSKAGEQQGNVEDCSEDERGPEEAMDCGRSVGQPVVKKAGSDLLEAGCTEEGYFFAEFGLRQKLLNGLLAEQCFFVSG